MSRESLLEIGARLKSSKWGGKSYLPIYDKLFAPFRDEPITIVEFGIDHGNSLLMWADYFLKARIIGIDCIPNNVINANRLHPRITAHCHLQQEEEVGRIVETFQPTIIIDDAGHNHADELICFNQCWSHVQKGGLYCIEDIQAKWEADVWLNMGAVVHANYTSSELSDYRYDDVLAVFIRN